ncbi:unnamed protein product [Linum tenue]|uniref:Uncharacterized protein n=1 Tax=Linum tenue TaxID=586396 RepID=A0AAV0M9M2_9ROSI|nr:unnamed protein product [Linum tenue]
MRSIEISTDNHFIDDLQNHTAISICVVKEHWDAYSQQAAWSRALVTRLDLAGGELKIHGATIRGQLLRDLAADLYRYQCRVNRDGFSIRRDSANGEYRRLNEMFPWYKYGVTPRFETPWDRLELSNDRKVIVDSSGAKAEVEGMRRREEELRREIGEKIRDLKEKEREWKGKEEELRREIGDNVRDLEEKEEEVRERDGKLKEKECEWEKKEAELNRKIEERDRVLEEKEGALKKKDRAIQGLKNALAALTEP